MRYRRKYLGSVPDGTPCGYCFQEWSTSWDHLVPWSYRADDRHDNLYPCCRRCNSILGNKMFASISEKREYVRQWLISRGLWKLPILPEAVSTETLEPNPLLKPVQMEDVEPAQPEIQERPQNGKVSSQIKPPTDNKPVESERDILLRKIWGGVSTIAMEMMMMRFGPHMEDMAAFCRSNPVIFLQEMAFIKKIDEHLYENTVFGECEEEGNASTSEAFSRITEIILHKGETLAQLRVQAMEAARVQALRAEDTV